MSKRLIAYMEGNVVGAFVQRDGGRIAFSYSPQWHQDWVRGQAHPISTALPVSQSDACLDATAFVAGLLPENARQRGLIGQELGLGDAPDDFKLLAMLGRDTAGALTIIPEGEEAAEPSVEWIMADAFAGLLRSLPQRPLLIDAGYGSSLTLAGVNEKTAVVISKGRIGLPRDGHPSTHMVKIDIPGLPGSIKTEHFCLRLASAVGLQVPKTMIHQVEDQTFMLMDRFDRRKDAQGNIERNHQEDFCQALGVMPGQKYERKGGPGWRDCFDLLRGSLRPDAARETLLRMAVFQFLSGNPDAHAKNYALVYRGRHGGCDLAPLYDLNNAAAFKHHFKSIRPVMAMRIGGQSDRDAVVEDDWMDFAAECDLPFEHVANTIMDMASGILDVMPGVYSRVDHCDAVDTAREDIEARCRCWAPQGLQIDISPRM